MYYLFDSYINDIDFFLQPNIASETIITTGRIGLGVFVLFAVFALLSFLRVLYTSLFTEFSYYSPDKYLRGDKLYKNKLGKMRVQLEKTRVVLPKIFY